MRTMRLQETRKRVVIEGVRPEIDCGRFPIKRVVGETVAVEADIFTDGHDALAAVLRYWREGAGWAEVPMQPVVNDRWRGEFSVTTLGRYRYSIRAWIDRFGTWQRDLAKKVEAGLDVSVELQMGAEMVARTAHRSPGPGAHTAHGHRAGSSLRHELRQGAPRGGGPGTGSIQHVVRALPPLDLAGTRKARHVQGPGGQASLRGGHGLRRALPVADPSDRTVAPEGEEQRDLAGAGRAGQSMGHRIRGGRAHRCPPRPGNDRGLRPACGAGPGLRP